MPRKVVTAEGIITINDDEDFEDNDILDPEEEDEFDEEDEEEDEFDEEDEEEY